MTLLCHHSIPQESSEGLPIKYNNNVIARFADRQMRPAIFELISNTIRFYNDTDIFYPLLSPCLQGEGKSGRLLDFRTFAENAMTLLYCPP